MAQITLRDYLQETEDAISSSHVDDALAHCQHMLRYFPEALEIQRLLGEVYLAQGRLEEAQQIFDWILMNDPENVLAYCNRADISERMSEYDVALDCYQQAYELNRGHGQIREEFNRLSEKVGQKGFMYSRAGLARLYMRGDLLSQAIQEWDAVLAVTPDRLDARIGQLETYWRAGLLEKVEQLAEQILHNVPRCLKALLLQASVISSKDSQRSQKLLHRAEALDPEHVIAQELFADALVKHPDDPFLRLLKSAPVLLPETKETAAPLELQQNSFASASDPVNSLGNSSVIDTLAQWGNDANGNNNTTLVKPQSDTTSAPSKNSNSPLWGLESVHDTPSIPDSPLPISNSTTFQASWNAPIQEMSNGHSSPETHMGSQEHSLEPWELLQNALNQFDTIGSEPRMATAEPFAAPVESQMVPYEKDLPPWENLSGSIELSQPDLDASPSDSFFMPKHQESISLSGIEAGLWSGPTEEPIPPANEKFPNPPSWLNMLAQTDIAENTNDTTPLTTESPSDNGLPLVEASLEQLAQPNTLLSEAQTPEAFISPPPSQPLPLTTSPEKTESQSSRLEAVDAEQSEEDEESFFGPSWLKSLGATTMAEEEAPVADAAEARTKHVAEPEYTDPQHEEHYYVRFSQHSEDLMQVPSAEYAETQSVSSQSLVPETNPYELWSEASLNTSQNVHDHTSWASAEFVQQPQNTKYETESPTENAYASGTLPPLPPVDLPTEQPVQWEAEQNLMTTLEELEKSLWSQGFIPLEPNSLSTLAAQTPESFVSSHDIDASKAPEEYDAQNFQQSAFRPELQEPQETPASPSLSSALAQLGNLVKEPAPPSAPSLASSSETLEQSEEPSWLQALKHSPATPAIPATPILPDISLESSAPAAYADDVPPTPPVAYGLAPHEPIITTSRHLTQPVVREPQQTAKAPAIHANPLLDGELETTMKRPAIRLQPMQQHSSPSQRSGGSHIVSRSQSGEHLEKAAKAIKPTNENLSYRDRLVKGYQYQLVGDYDEAMQEYRIIIRSGNDLLSEVVSNVRALLKLAPNYTAGFRVLGDAYMRQGEYLQAMEAYNKALTMAKKVKSQA